MINFIVWLIAGAVMGWLATLLIHRRHPILRLNILVGSIGGFLTGFLIVPMFHIDTTSFSLPALLVSLIGSIIFLMVINFFVREHNVANKMIKNQWSLVRDKIPVRWDKITEEDLDQINGDHEQLTNLIAERYGISNKEAEDQIQGYLEAVLTRSSRLNLLHKQAPEANSLQRLN